MATALVADPQVADRAPRVAALACDDDLLEAELGTCVRGDDLQERRDLGIEREAGDEEAEKAGLGKDNPVVVTGPGDGRVLACEPPECPLKDACLDRISLVHGLLGESEQFRSYVLYHLPTVLKAVTVRSVVRQIQAAGSVVEAQPKVFDLLVYLIENRDRVVDKDELLEQLWPGTVVTDSALTQIVRKARTLAGVGIADEGAADHHDPRPHGPRDAAVLADDQHRVHSEFVPAAS